MFTLPKLNYDYNALEPWIDEQTMTIHHTKHHQTYIDKLNAEIEKNQALKEKSLDELCGSEVPAVKNNAGGHWNHTFFWEILSPAAESKKLESSNVVKLREKIDESFGGFENFQKQFKEAALARFGSGWVWLGLENNKLVIETTANQDVPKSHVVLALDVWEHAYYLKYQNRRADYVDAFWNVVNWEKVCYIMEN